MLRRRNGKGEDERWPITRSPSIKTSKVAPRPKRQQQVVDRNVEMVEKIGEIKNLGRTFGDPGFENINI